MSATPTITTPPPPKSSAPDVGSGRRRFPTTVRVGRLFGIPFDINLSVLVVAAFVVWSLAFQILPSVHPDTSTAARLGAAVASAALFLVSILGHELGHAMVAKRHDVETMSITLWLLGGVAKLVRQAPTPRAEFQIAAAGPAASALLAGLFAGLTFTANRLTDWLLIPVVLAWLAAINLLLAISNMFPAAPLDGGRVLTAGLWKRMGDAEAARLISARCGLLLGFVLVAAGAVAVAVSTIGVGWVSVIIMGLFLIVAARSEVIGAAIRGRLNEVTVGELMSSHPASLPAALPVAQFLAATSANPNVATPLTHWDHTPVGYVIPAQLAGLDPFTTSTARVEAFAVSAEDVPRAWSTEPLARVTERLGDLQPSMVVVHDPTTGLEVGTISAEQFGRALTLPDQWGRLDPLSRMPEVAARGPVLPGSPR